MFLWPNFLYTDKVSCLYRHTDISTKFATGNTLAAGDNTPFKNTKKNGRIVVWKSPSGMKFLSHRLSSPHNFFI